MKKKRKKVKTHDEFMKEVREKNLIRSATFYLTEAASMMEKFNYMLSKCQPLIELMIYENLRKQGLHINKDIFNKKESEDQI